MNWPGVVSLELRPYRPPTTRISPRPAWFRAVTTSRYTGSPTEPVSLERSSTAIFLQVAGMAAAKCFTEKGRYRWICTMPTLRPCLFRKSTVSFTASLAEHMTTMTSSASGAP